MNYAAKFGKSYESVAEMQERKQNLKANQAKNEQLQKENPRAKFGDTMFTDWSDAEFQAMLGLKGQERRLEAEVFEAPEGRELQSYSDIDWSTTGKMTPVKNQGGCGSCWAFCATTVLEAMVSIQKSTAPVRMSEQQAVDCSTGYGNGGCNGGWMSNYYRYSRDAGSGFNSDYIYTATDQTCAWNSSMAIAARADMTRFYSQGSSATVSGIYAALENGPQTIALNANGWGGYQGGVLELATFSCDPMVINHGVTLVGFTAGETTTEEITTIVPGGTSTTCYRASRNERRAKSCSTGTYQSKKCCVTTTSEGTTTTETITTVSGASWKVQNSWGSGWGDAGFIHFEAVEGYGLCGMNRYVEGIYVQ
jgi:cathepsin L